MIRAGRRQIRSGDLPEKKVGKSPASTLANSCTRRRRRIHCPHLNTTAAAIAAQQQPTSAALTSVIHLRQTGSRLLSLSSGALKARPSIAPRGAHKLLTTSVRAVRAASYTQRALCDRELNEPLAGCALFVICDNGLVARRVVVVVVVFLVEQIAQISSRRCAHGAGGGAPHFRSVARPTNGR